MRYQLTLDKKQRIELPAELCKMLALEAGDDLELTLQDGQLCLRPDPFKKYMGPWREGEGLSLEDILAHQRELRGWNS